MCDIIRKAVAGGKIKIQKTRSSKAISFMTAKRRRKTRLAKIKVNCSADEVVR